MKTHLLSAIALILAACGGSQDEPATTTAPLTMRTALGSIEISRDGAELSGRATLTMPAAANASRFVAGRLVLIADGREVASSEFQAETAPNLGLTVPLAVNVTVGRGSAQLYLLVDSQAGAASSTISGYISCMNC